MYFQFNLESLLRIYLQPNGSDQNTIGQTQHVICSLSLPPYVDPDTVEFGWINEDDIITDDSRVTVNKSHDYANEGILVTVIQFDPIIENDKGEYICYMIINESLIFESINLQHFTSKYASICCVLLGYNICAKM